MALIQIYYSPNTFENLINRVSSSITLTIIDKNILKNMLIELSEMDYLLYAIEILDKQIFSFEINEFNKYKEFLIDFVYGELIDQLFNEYNDHEDIYFTEIRKRFSGMTFDINLIYAIDRRFNKLDTKVIY